MKTLLVTPFAPYRDGIATYAAQELRALRRDGQEVEVLSPQPSAARWHLRLGGPAGMVQLSRKAARYERVVIQFGPELLFGSCRSAGQRVAVWTALAALARQTSLDMRIHEIEYEAIELNPFERRAAKLALGQADRVTVHTEAERARLNQLLGLGRRIEVVEHGRDFIPTVRLSKPDARRELGLAVDDYTFVSIGFLQHHKGFDRAVDAIAAIDLDRIHLHVVGSARVDHPDITGYVDELARAAAESSNATLHQRFVSDVEFDLWLQAADAVVLPYREIWSSGVVERARLFGTQVIAADLPQLRDQAPPGTIFASEVDELAMAMEAVALSSGQTSIMWADGADTANGATLAVSPHGSLDGLGPMHGRRSSDLAQAEAARAQWDVNTASPDRARIEEQIVARARDAEIANVGERNRGANARRPVDSLLALGHLHRPQPTSARPGVAPVKRLIERLIGWQVNPLAARIEELQRATLEAVAQLDQPTQAETKDVEKAQPPAPETQRTEAAMPSAAATTKTILTGHPPMPPVELDLSDPRTAGTRRTTS